MSTLEASQIAPRVSARQIAAIGVVLLTILAVFGVIGPVLPAEATHPTIEASVVCTNGVVMIEWTSRSWLQDPTNDAASGNPSIFIRFNGVKVAEGAYTAANNYEFSGSNPWPDPNVTTVMVLAYANAPFNNGEGQGTSRGRTVTLPPDCPNTTTTTQPPTTTTTQPPTTTTTQPPTTTTTQPPTTTTTQPPTTTTTQPPTTTTTEPPTTTTTEPPTTTTTQPPTTTTGPPTISDTDVLGIQVSAPENAQVNQVTQETLPFTGISTGSMALLAAAMAGAGLLLLLAARQNDEKSPARSWN
jgi:hypothetical protein